DLLLPARPRGCGPALEVGFGRRPRRILGPGGRRLVGGAHAPRPEVVDDVAALEGGVDAVPPGERAQFVIGQRIQAVVSGRPGAGRLLRALHGPFGLGAGGLPLGVGPGRQRLFAQAGAFGQVRLPLEPRTLAGRLARGRPRFGRSALACGSPRLALSLARLERGVGLTERVAHGARQRHLDVAHLPGAENLLGPGADRLGLVFGRQDHELIAAPAEDASGYADLLRGPDERAVDLADHLVAGLLADLLVDLAEVVGVEDDDGGVRVGLCGRERAVQCGAVA